MDDKRQDEKRRNQRLAMASHVLNANVISWEREAFMNSRKVVLRSLFLADLLIHFADEFPEGEIDPTTI